MEGGETGSPHRWRGGGRGLQLSRGTGGERGEGERGGEGGGDWVSRSIAKGSNQNQELQEV